ncbi:17469_t:CDS:2, partial [Cetraspora pellucida]
MEDRVTITALELKPVPSDLKVEQTSSSFEPNHSSFILNVDYTFPTLEVKKTSNLEVVVTSLILEAKKAFTSSDVEITSPSFTGIEFAFPNSNYKHPEVTSPIYTYQHLEVSSHSSNCQDVTSPSNFGYQVFRNDKDSNDSTITCRKSFHCSANGTYNAWKKIDQNLCRLHGNTKLNYIYNAIYCLCENHKDEKLDSSLFLEALFEKMIYDPDWK